MPENGTTEADRMRKKRGGEIPEVIPIPPPGGYGETPIDWDDYPIDEAENKEDLAALWEELDLTDYDLAFDDWD